MFHMPGDNHCPPERRAIREVAAKYWGLGSKHT
jgi:hypothetical protein